MPLTTGTGDGCFYVNSLLASGDFFHLPITFSNSLDPDQDQHFVSLDLDPNCLTH